MSEKSLHRAHGLEGSCAHHILLIILVCMLSPGMYRHPELVLQYKLPVGRIDVRGMHDCCISAFSQSNQLSDQETLQVDGKTASIVILEH